MRNLIKQLGIFIILSAALAYLIYSFGELRLAQQMPPPPVPEYEEPLHEDISAASIIDAIMEESLKSYQIANSYQEALIKCQEPQNWRSLTVREMLRISSDLIAYYLDDEQVVPRDIDALVFLEAQDGVVVIERLVEIDSAGVIISHNSISPYWNKDMWGEVLFTPRMNNALKSEYLSALYPKRSEGFYLIETVVTPTLLGWERERFANYGFKGSR